MCSIATPLRRSPQPGRCVHERVGAAEAVDDQRVAQAWFQGINPRLQDESPARAIRDGDTIAVGPTILAAARSLVGAE
jgi:hypothetical protein